MTEYLAGGNQEKCCGCGSCAGECPVGAIELLEDSEGFLYPEVDKSICIACGRCGRVCPCNNMVGGNTPLKTYAFINQNPEELLNSSSGGAFIAFADAVLNDGGFVCGCILDENLRAVHTLTSEADIINKMQGSKYVQSRIGGVYKEIEEKLKNGKAVLFSGTPCQVDGLKKYLGQEYSGLYTLDLICHGVPSPRLLSRFVEAEEKSGKKVEDIKFRDKKRNGWRSWGTITYAIDHKKKAKVISPFNNSYYQLYYLRNIVSRPCCYTCRYANTSRVGDITIGDYWSVEEILPGTDTSGGVSAVLVNTEKGQKLMERINGCAEILETPLAAAVAGNGNLSAPCKKPEGRDGIYERIEKDGYETVGAEECRYSRIIPLVRRYIPGKLKMLLKRIRQV